MENKTTTNRASENIKTHYSKRPPQDFPEKNTKTRYNINRRDPLVNAAETNRAKHTKTYYSKRSRNVQKKHIKNHDTTSIVGFSLAFDQTLSGQTPNLSSKSDLTESPLNCKALYFSLTPCKRSHNVLLYCFPNVCNAHNFCVADSPNSANPSKSQIIF